MRKKIWLGSLLLVASVLWLGSAAWAQEIYVIAGGGPPVGTKITSLPFPISNPGFYYLTGDLSSPGTGDGITVNCWDVTIDLMGFTITGPNNGGINAGIRINCGNVEVRNGNLKGWQSALKDTTGIKNRALNLRIGGCSYGIDFEGAQSGDLVKNCTVEGGITGIYIYGGVASGNVVKDAWTGIFGYGTISGNAFTNCSTGISGYGTINHNSVFYTSDTGIKCTDASSIIGNTIVAVTGTPAGISVNTPNPVLVTQNTVSGPGTHFTGGSGTVNVANTNAGF